MVTLGKYLEKKFPVQYCRAALYKFIF